MLVLKFRVALSHARAYESSNGIILTIFPMPKPAVGIRECTDHNACRYPPASIPSFPYSFSEPYADNASHTSHSDHTCLHREPAYPASGNLRVSCQLLSINILTASMSAGSQSTEFNSLLDNHFDASCSINTSFSDNKLHI